MNKTAGAQKTDLAPGMPDPLLIPASPMVTNVLPKCMPIKVEEYIREDASIPYKQWFDGLSSQAAAKVTVAVK